MSIEMKSFDSVAYTGVGVDGHPLLEDDREPSQQHESAAEHSQYNFGPRKVTDAVFGVVFVLVLAVFFGWSGYTLHQASDSCKSTTMFVWDFSSSEWEYEASSETCHRINCGQGSTSAVTTTAPDRVGTTCDNTIITLIGVPLIVAVAGGMIMGVLMIVGFKYQPYFMVYLSCAVQILAPAALGVFLMVEAHREDTDTQTDDIDDQATSSDSSSLVIAAYILFVASGLMALVYIWCYSSIKLCAELFQFAAVGIQQNFCLIPLQALFVLVAMAVKIAMLVLLVAAMCTVQVSPPLQFNDFDDNSGNDNSVNDNFGNDNYGNDNLDEYSPMCTYRLQSHVWPYLCLSLFSIGWYSFWALETRNYITADVIGHWYWHGKEGSSILRGVSHAFCSHFGTIAFAGLCVWFIDWLKRQARTPSRHPIACICGLIAQCILSYIEYLFKMAVVVVAISGWSFVTSGKQVGRLFWSSHSSMMHSAGVWLFPPRILWVFCVVLSAVWGVLYGVSAYHPVKKDCESGKLCLKNDDLHCHNFAVTYAVVIGILVWLVVWFLLAFFSSILLTVVDTTFICFLMDKQAHVVTKPKFHAIFGSVLTYKAKNSRPRKGPPEKPPRYLREAPPPPYRASRPGNIVQPLATARPGNVVQGSQPRPESAEYLIPSPAPPSLPNVQRPESSSHV
eukprot:m.218146 g.218146  ORF g.218146 m.218146 type:complete len:675 (-) comp19141_c0_seq21:262-2286(-)